MASKRFLDLNVRQDVLEGLKTARSAATQVHINTDFGSPLYCQASELTRAIDALAELLTGDPEHLWLKPHSSG